MNKLLEEFYKIGIIPVVKLSSPDEALPLAKALVNGGLPVAEITFRTDAAEESIKKISAECPEMLVGAGTVLTVDQVKRAVNAGAKFIVTPGFNPKVVGYCVENNIPITPGCSTASNIEEAIEFGLDVVKFFPAENLGGIKTIKALSGPYVNMKFIPTGGVNSENLNDYLSSDKILACGGSWMVKSDLIDAGRYDAVEEMTKEAVKTMLGYKLGHIGINVSNEKDAEKDVNLITKIFGFNSRECDVSYFVGDDKFEYMKSNGRGTCGHIAVKTNSVDRAVYRLEKANVKLDYSSAKYDKNGKMTFIYLADEIAGFAIHLCRYF